MERSRASYELIYRRCLNPLQRAARFMTHTLDGRQRLSMARKVSLMDLFRPRKVPGMLKAAVRVVHQGAVTRYQFADASVIAIHNDGTYWI